MDYCKKNRNKHLQHTIHHLFIFNKYIYLNIFCLYVYRHSSCVMAVLNHIKKLLFYLTVTAIITTGFLYYKQHNKFVKPKELATRKPRVLADIAGLNAILSRKYIADLEDIRRKLLQTNLTTNTVHRNLSAPLDTRNHTRFIDVLSQHRINGVHSIWLSESDDVLAPYMVKNYYPFTMSDCHVYKRVRGGNCYTDPQDVQTPIPFSKALHMDVIVRSYSINSHKQSQYNFTYILVFAGAITTPSGDVVKDNWKVVPWSCHPDELFYYFQPTSRLGRYREVFVLAQHKGTTFFHFTIENLPRIAAYLSFLLRHPTIKIHVRTKTGFTLPFLAALGIASSRLVSEYSQADIVYMPAGTPCGQTTLFNVQLVSLQLRAGLSDPAPPRDTIILIRRSKKRWFNHHDDIFAMIRKHADSAGLKAVVYGDNPVPGFNETRQLFSRAYIVVAPHGAGESNLIFSQPGTILVEALCYDKTGQVNFCYVNMARVLGLRYNGLLFGKQCMNITAADVEPVVKYYVDKLKR